MLCLNMIVKNEGARVLRALNAAKPYISAFAILDTGSTDDTVAIIRKWGDDNGIRGIVGIGSFVSFSQARNEALNLARSWRAGLAEPDFGYLLLQDADMELVVEDALAFSTLDAEAYEMSQTAGAVTYGNTRLLAVWSGANYVGRTHEYLAVQPHPHPIVGARFVDHADGANRKDKYERDVKLLKQDIDDDPKNPRPWFYLGNTYRDMGMWADAQRCYTKRLELGGWDEELFVTRTYIAQCRKEQGDSAGYVDGMLAAYQSRPQRAEPLYDLSKYFREKGDHHTAMVFAETGIAIERPNDRLFVNDYVYSHGLREEYSIAGFYSERTRERAFKITNSLALDLDDARARGLARSNLVWYLKPLREMAPSARHTQLAFTPRAGMVAMNPSICGHRVLLSGFECIVRTVNYRINEHGQYMIGEKGCQDAPIETENFLLTLNPDLSVFSSVPIVWDRPPAKFPLVIGLEDMRLYWTEGQRRFIACVREQSEWGHCEQWDGHLAYRFGDPKVAVVEDAERVSDGFTNTEKNWAPIYLMDKQRYVYRLNTVTTAHANELLAFSRSFACLDISGSSQWIDFEGARLAVVHEAVIHPGTGKRVYWHRFAWADRQFMQMRVSLPFTFQATQIEFCAGLAVHPTERKVVMSYGVRDEEAWFTTISNADVMAMVGAD